MVKSVESNPLTLLDLYMIDSFSDGITSKLEYALYNLEALRGCGEASEDEVMKKVRELTAGVFTGRNRLN